MGRSWRKAVLGWSVALVAVVALVASAIATATRAGAAPAELVGPWSRKVTKADLRKHGEDAGTAGVWAVEIRKGGSASLFAPGTPCCGSPDVTMTFTAAGGSSTFGPNNVCPSKGSYASKVSGRSLTLKATADNCVERVAILNGVWTRK
jgi:hypothetical protein